MMLQEAGKPMDVMVPGPMSTWIMSRELGIMKNTLIPTLQEALELLELADLMMEECTARPMLLDTRTNGEPMRPTWRLFFSMVLLLLMSRLLVGGKDMEVEFCMMENVAMLPLILTVYIPLITLSSLLAMVTRVLMTTGSSRTHGALGGARVDTSSCTRELVTVVWLTLNKLFQPVLLATHELCLRIHTLWKWKKFYDCMLIINKDFITKFKK